MASVGSTAWYGNPAARASTITPKPTSRLSGLDGLRAIAVVGVLLYHADVAWLPGGFLGVDLFFVISGFLITWLLIAERQRYGGIALGRFYLRRARRLLPALVAMVVTTTVFMALFFRSDLDQARGDVGAAAGYFSNWWYILHHRSYFVASGRQPPFLHLWSLAVEEQFYLLWPVLLIIVLLVRARLRWVFAVAVCGAVASAWWMRVIAIQGNVPFDTDSSRVYFGTDTHASALLLGAAGAAVMAALARRRARVAGGEVSLVATVFADLIGLGSLAAVGYAMHEVSEWSPRLYHGGFFVFAAATLLVVVTVSLPGSLLGGLLDVAPLRWIGARSYGLYLWHWPVFVYTRPGLDWQLHGWQALAARLAITAVLTELTFRLLERPIRERGFLEFASGLRWRFAPSGRLVAPVLGGVCGVLLVVGLTTFASHHHSPGARAVSATGPSTAPPTDQPSGAASSAMSSPSATPTAASSPSRTSMSTRSASSNPPAKTTTKPPAKTTKPAPPPVVGSPPPMAIQGGPPPALTALGDSVMLDGQAALMQDCPDTEVYAKVGWQATTVFEQLDALRVSGHIGQIVVIGTGTNGIVEKSKLDAELTALADRAKVVIINDHMARKWEPANNAMFPEVVNAHANAVLVDWDSVANQHPDWFGPDGVHLLPKADQPYADLIKAAAGC